jgi:hypothetical protein
MIRGRRSETSLEGVGAHRHCNGLIAMRRGGVVQMAMVISLSHQARMACYHGGSHKNGSAKGYAEQATAGRQQLAGRQRQPWRCWQSSGTARHPGHCVQLCIIHAWARRVCSVLDVIAISVPAVRRLLPASAAPSRAEARKLHHARILPYPALSSSGLPADQSLALRGWRMVCLGRPSFAPYVLSGAWLGGRLHQRAAFRCVLPLPTLQRCPHIPDGCLLHSFDASSQRHIDRLGRLRDPLRMVIRPSAHVAHAGPDAISSSQHWRAAPVQQLASRTSPARLHPRSPRYKLAQWLWPLSCSDLSGR